jgi:hypothetical protein
VDPKSKRLVAASGTTGTHVRLWVPSPRGGDYGPYVMGLVWTQIGWLVQQ